MPATEQNITVTVNDARIKDLKRDLGIEVDIPLEFVYDPSMRGAAGGAVCGRFSGSVSLYYKFLIFPRIRNMEGKITVNLAHATTAERLVETILHEYRHVWQLFKRPLRFQADYDKIIASKDYRVYHDSWIETDARKFAYLNSPKYRDIVTIDT